MRILNSIWTFHFHTLLFSINARNSRVHHKGWSLVWVLSLFLFFQKIHTHFFFIGKKNSNLKYLEDLESKQDHVFSVFFFLIYTIFSLLWTDLKLKKNVMSSFNIRSGIQKENISNKILIFILLAWNHLVSIQNDSIDVQNKVRFYAVYKHTSKATKKRHIFKTKVVFFWLWILSSLSFHICFVSRNSVRTLVLAEICIKTIQFLVCVCICVRVFERIWT